MKNVKYLFLAFLLVLFYGCASKMDVKREAIETMGEELFSNFKFNLSKDIILREVVLPGAHLVQTSPGAVTISNRELHFSHSIIGRFQRQITPDRIEISFEELLSGSRPALTFERKVVNGREFYCIKTVFDEGYVADATAEYGYIKIKGNIVSYGGAKYFLLYHGDEEPYLIQELDVHVMQERREIRGIKK